MEETKRCPICERSFSSRKFVLVHLARHHPIEDQQMCEEAPPVHENSGSSSEAPVDLLPWPIKTRKRGSNNMALVVVEAAGRNEIVLVIPPPSPSPERHGMELALYDENGAWDAMDLPLVKRLMFIRHQAHHRNRFICYICGRVYTNHRALGGHKAQHTIGAKKKEWPEEQNCHGAPVVYMARRRPAGGAHQCPRCGKVFSSGQGLGGHKQHCRGQPPPPAESDRTRAVRDFDLNDMPLPEEDGGHILALPWYNNNDDN